jgi:gas vesicle protein
MQSKSSGSPVWAFLGGLTVGMLSAFLLAPRSGQETRERIAEGAKEGKEILQDAIEEAKYQIGASLEEATERLAGAVDTGSKAYRTELRIARAEHNTRSLS